MDVDGLHGMPGAEVWTEDLHVTRQHQQIYVQFLQRLLCQRFLAEQGTASGHGFRTCTSDP